MVWIPLMTRNSLRRRQSQSPSSSSDSSHKCNKPFFGSKSKRRIFSRESSLTVTSSRSSECSDNAAWRVENIRVSAPTEDEWWQDAGTPSESSTVEEPACDSFEVANAGTNNNIDARVVVEAVGLMPLRNNKAFHNCGLETWLRVREEWRHRTVVTLPQKPTPAERSQIIKGLTKASAIRTYELPRRMGLSDLIRAYNHMWEGGL